MHSGHCTQHGGSHQEFIAGELQLDSYIPSAGGIRLVHAALTQQLDHAVHVGQVTDDFIYPVIRQGRPSRYSSFACMAPVEQAMLAF